MVVEERRWEFLVTDDGKQAADVRGKIAAR
jgi:hypothetical protein